MAEDILTLPAPAPDIRIAYGALAAQCGDLRLPAGTGPFPLAIVLHGGYWRARYDLTYFGHACASLAAAGIATWNVEYRRVGMPGGGWPGTFLDVAKAADFAPALARAFPLDLARVLAIGHSAGGHLASWLASRHRIPPTSPLFTPHPLSLTGVVSLAGVLDLRRAWELGLSDNATAALLGGGPDELPDRYAVASPIELLPAGVRHIVIHGTRDANVPFESSERYAQAAAAVGDPVELVALPDAGHFEIVDPRTPEWQRVLAAIHSLLP